VPRLFVSGRGRIHSRLDDPLYCLPGDGLGRVFSDAASLVNGFHGNRSIAGAIVDGVVLFFFLVILNRLNRLFFEERIYNKNNGQNRRQYHAHDYPCRAAYMHLIVEFADQDAEG
jgi:hypothetical protein